MLRKEVISLIFYFFKTNDTLSYIANYHLQ